jgi:dihydroxy-acid dehydratase
VLELGRVCKEAVLKEGFLAWQYNTIGVSDGICQGNDGKQNLATETTD